MASVNKVMLIGNLTRDPQIRDGSKTMIVEFGVAVNRKWKNDAGELKEDVCFVDCTAFGKTAELADRYLSKGNPVHIEGRLKFDQWEAKDGSGKRSKLSVVVENLQFLGSPRQADDSANTTARANVPGKSPESAPVEEFKQDDIPF